jgi:hypothetical protein
MGWETIAGPGTEFGPCQDDCQHTDCAATREMATSKCTICGEPIDYETKFYQEEPGKYAHALCVWEREEQRQARLKENG